MQSEGQLELPNVKVGRFLVENSKNNRNNYQNTWSSGSTQGPGNKASPNDKPTRPALGRSASFQSHSSMPRCFSPIPSKLALEENGEQKSNLRTLCENPKKQPEIKKEDDVQCEDSGYLSTFNQGMSGSLPPAGWDNNETMSRLQEQEEGDDFDSIYTSLLSQSQLKNSLMRMVRGQEDNFYNAVDEKTKTMNKKKRIVKKGGLPNVDYKNISKKRRRFFSDLYTTLLDSSWTFSVVMFSASFYGSWLLFGALYFLICYFHGDFMEENLMSTGNGWIPCILQIDGFVSCFLFSIETQHTIGYGSRQPTAECPAAIVVVSLQAVIGCIIQAFMVGLVFSKLSRPRNRSRTIIFSNHAVVTLRNGKLCLIMRIGDLRDDNFLLGTKISLRLLKRSTTQEGEIYQEMKNLKVTPDTTDESCLFFVWPLDIVHVIGQDSPFYEMSPADLAKERFELILVMEGTNETSNMNFQARTSYLPQEILWGHRFEQMVIYRREQKKFQVNFSAFHSTYEVNTPLCSAKNLEMFQRGRQFYQKPSMVE